MYHSASARRRNPVNDHNVNSQIVHHLPTYALHFLRLRLTLAFAPVALKLIVFETSPVADRLEFPENYIPPDNHCVAYICEPILLEFSVHYQTSHDFVFKKLSIILLNKTTLVIALT